MKKLNRLITIIILIFFIIINLITNVRYVFAQETSDASASTTASTPTPTQPPQQAINDVSIVQTSIISADKSIEVSTSDNIKSATVEASIINIVNSNFVGNNLDSTIINVTAPNTEVLDLSRSNECINQNNQFEVSSSNISNLAEIDNKLQVIINSDNNLESSPEAATIKGHIFNMANTNILGNCASFNVINLFSEQANDILLPYELDYIKPDLSGNPAMTGVIADISNINQSSTQNFVTASTIVTDENGIAVNKVNILDLHNTNIYADNWLMLNINNYGNWYGNIINRPANYLPEYNAHFDSSVITPVAGYFQNYNNARIRNSVFLSGLAQKSAYSQVDIVNLINTNIIGNNWHFSIINIFDDFKGNIIFPRPDLLLEMSPAELETNPGENFRLVVKFANTGTYPGKKTKLKISLPNYISLVSSSQLVNHDLGTVAPGSYAVLEIPLHIDHNSPPGKYAIDAIISTETDEPHLTNNSKTSVISVKQEVKIKQENLSPPVENSQPSVNFQVSSHPSKPNTQRDYYQANDVLSASGQKYATVPDVDNNKKGEKPGLSSVTPLVIAFIILLSILKRQYVYKKQ